MADIPVIRSPNRIPAGFTGIYVDNSEGKTIYDMYDGGRLSGFAQSFQGAQAHFNNTGPQNSRGSMSNMFSKKRRVKYGHRYFSTKRCRKTSSCRVLVPFCIGYC